MPVMKSRDSSWGVNRMDAHSGSLTMEFGITECGYAGKSERWGQPPASCYVFGEIGGNRMGHLVSGTYASFSPSDVSLGHPVYEPEVEDAILLDSGILPLLVQRARDEAQSADLDWESEFDEL